jgi:magnesium transporter
MREWYGIEGGKIRKRDSEGIVLSVVAPDEAEGAALCAEYGIDHHDLRSALDPEELGRVERESDHIVVILKRPCNYTGEGKLLFSVTSVGLFLFKSRLVVISPAELEFSGDKMFREVRDHKDVLLKILYGVIDHFLGHLKVINMLSASLETRMTESMGNRYLLDMFSLEKSLVYFVNGLSSNAMVVEKLVEEPSMLKLSKPRFEVLKDIMTENRQCQKQAEIYSDILMGLMGAHASVVNNNLNLLMKRLTVISIVFMPLNLLAGIGGMSEFSTWTSGMPWFVSYAIFLLSLLPIAAITYALMKRSGLDRSDADGEGRRSRLALPRIPGAAIRSGVVRRALEALRGKRAKASGGKA